MKPSLGLVLIAPLVPAHDYPVDHRVVRRTVTVHGLKTCSGSSVRTVDDVPGAASDTDPGDLAGTGTESQ
jgi:hypothetical protein